MCRNFMLPVAVVLVLLIPMTSMAASEAQGFPAKTSGAAVYSSPAAADIDGDGEIEIAFVAGGLLDVWKSDGTMAAGFPVVLREKAEITASPALGDIDGDGKMEVVVGSTHGALFAFDAKGTPIAGFPKMFGTGRVGSPALFDIDGDRRLEIFVGAADGKLHCLKASGGECRGFPVDTGTEVSASPAVGYFGPEQKLSVVAGTDDGKLRAWDAGTGREISGFPVATHYRISAPPVLADINDDGRNEIIFASQDYKLYVVDGDGKAIEGFPFATDYRIHSSPALGDLDGDGRLDVVIGSADGNVYALNARGKLLKGFPFKTGNRVFASAAVGDFDCDGLAEIAIPSTDGNLHVIRGDGTPFSGFPENIGGEISSTPFAGDINGDGKVEVVVATPRGDLHAFRMTGKCEKKPKISWPGLAHDPQRTGRYYPNPARFSDVAINPEKPPAGDAISVGYKYAHLDGDAETNTQVRWFRNEKLIPEHNNQKAVPAKVTRKHEKWQVMVQEGRNFEEYKDGKGARIYRSPEVEVRNIPPDAPKVKLLPEAPRNGDRLSVKILQDATDADGDKVTYRYFWLKNHALMKYPPEQDYVEGKDVRKGEKWSVVVTPFDGEETGKTAEGEAKVLNTPPGAPEVKVEPDAPRVTEKVVVKIAKAAPDVDGDAVTYRYTWTVDGKPVNFGAEADVLSPGMIAKNKKFSVTVTPNDGDADGTPVKAEGRTLNTPPEKPEVAVVPAKPTVLDGFSAVVKKESGDVDGDAIGYAFAWYRNGEMVSGQKAPSVPGKDLKKGETWKVSVIPSDGEKDGPAGEASATVVNAPPAGVEAELSVSEAKAGEKVELKIAGQPADPDGDKPNLRFRWHRDGKPVAALNDQQVVPASEIRKNQTWKVEMWADDGELSGPGNVRYFYSKNTPPAKPQIALNTRTPRAADGLTVSVEKPATDPDGDKVSYRYRWHRFGQEMEAFRERTGLKPADLKKGEVWTVAVTPWDGEAEGERASETAAVVNTKPDAGEVEILPKSPGRLDRPQCKVVRKASDADGDALRTRLVWRRNGKPVPSGAENDVLPPGSFAAGDKLGCELAASDGDSESVARSAEVTVVNSAPDAPTVTIDPEKPRTGKPMACVISKTARDVDGDEVTYSYAWEKNGASAGVTASEVEGARVMRGDAWRCVVTPSDGKAQGKAGSAQAKIGNSPPAAPKVSVSPANPAAGQALKCEITAAAADPDGDKVSYKFFWYKDGIQQKFATTTVEIPGRQVKEGDMWACEIVPNDGKEDGEKADSIHVLVGAKK
ncbi:MAG: VCBS repeat-containing protein [Deltaproteobacteria bacterium]|nr:VCBS repeat-containing protein [Deltaproteobacteria bacterium]